MIEAIILITIGAFIGWSIPQPAWAAALQDKVVSFFRSK